MGAGIGRGGEVEMLTPLLADQVAISLRFLSIWVRKQNREKGEYYNDTYFVFFLLLPLPTNPHSLDTTAPY